jgi:glycosyltransferase involved in cell wall biosynthesis
LHILFLTDNFPPEGNAPASRTYEHAIRWVEQGSKVTVITTVPNFPEGKVYAGYKNKIYQRECIDGIDIVRVMSFITANEGFLLRTIDYLSFMITGFFAGVFQKSPDVIVATSPQFFTACSGWLISVIRRRPFVFELRDLWPASILALGAIKNNTIISLLEKTELFLYRQSKGIVTVTNAFKEDLISRGIDGEKILVSLNGVDLNRFKPAIVKDEVLLKKYNLHNKFIIGYIGTHGLAHELNSIIDAAVELQKYSEIVFLLVGSGSERSKLIEDVKKRGVSNVLFVESQPKDMINKYWSLCDISLIHLKNIEIFKTVIPSKLFESMGMGLPVLMAMPEGEATKIVKEYNIGIVITSGIYEELVENILELKENKRLLDTFKKNSLQASKVFSRAKQAKKMLNFFTKLTNSVPLNK